MPGFLRTFIPLISFFCLIIVLNFTVDILYEKKLLQTERQRQLQMSLQSLQRDITGIVRSLLYLAEGDTLRRFINHRDVADTQQDIAAFARRMARYDQIRWLDFDGIERLRIDYRDGKTHIVPSQDLQDKSDRYYFKEAIVLPPGTIYVSPLDLNMEHGRIEVPYRPMLRFATPTRGKDGKTNGLLILNYQASIMLDNFADTLAAPNTDLALLNAQGFWFYSSRGESAWGFMFDQDERFSNSYPRAWREIATHTQGNIETDEGLFTFASFDVLEVSRKTGTGDALFPQLQEKPLPFNNNRWIVVTRSPLNIISAINYEHYSHYTLLLLLSLTVLALLSWRSARVALEKNNLLDRLSLHATVMENATNGIMITDRENRIVSINNAFTELTGYTAEEVLGKDPSILSSERHGEAFFADMWFALEERGHWEGELWNRHKNGELYPEWVSITAVTDRNGELSNYIGIFSLLSEQKSTEARLRELANSDPLTGLINRNLFLDRAAQALVSARRSQSKTAILFLDLDGFKPVNDSMGHIAGDSVLRDTARRLQDTVRGSDTVARFGGDEFVILLTGLKDAEEAAVVSRKLIEAVSQPLEFNGMECRISASIGISVCPNDAETVESLIKCADVAMYAAKENGRGRYCFYRDGESGNN